MTELIKYDEKIFTPTSLCLPETMTFDEWLALAPVLRTVRDASLWWWGDYINFGERKYGERYSQALGETDYSYGTLANASYISRQIESSRRRENVPMSFHQEVAPLTPELQEVFLDKCEQEGWHRSELRSEIRKANKVFAIKEMPKGVYDLIYCDPPWQYDFAETNNRKIENQYPTMTTDEICNMNLPTTDANSLLLMWSTAPKLEESLRVISAWGFTYRTHGIWDKKLIGMGYWFRGQHELLLVAVKGSYPVPEASMRESSIYSEQRTEHSRKPTYYYEWIKKSFPYAKKIELFARTKYDDTWEVWGNE
jgi:N6-adenosine-specific RNA methylase IME4